DQIEDDRTIRLALALNLDIGEICRVILFAEGGWGKFQYWDPVGPGNPNESFPFADAMDRSVATRFFIQVNLAF
ncbi:unnamed protein product, partial [marine sediment metagenome]